MFEQFALHITEKNSQVLYQWKNRRVQVYEPCPKNVPTNEAHGEIKVFGPKMLLCNSRTVLISYQVKSHITKCNYVKRFYRRR